MLPAAAVGLATVLPIGHLVVRAIEASDAVALLASARIRAFLWTTLVLATTVTALAVVVGTAIAWLVERTDLPGRRVLGVIGALPLVVPTYVAALALVATFGPGGLGPRFGWIFGFRGATLALVLSTYPYVMLTVRAALARSDPALEEAARALGDRPRAVARRVVLPHLRPAMSAGGLLVFLYVLSDFGAVSILRVDTLTRAMYLEYRGTFDRGRPAVLGVVLVLVTLVALAAERRMRGRAVPTRRASAGERPHVLRPLGRWRWPAAAFVGGVGGLGAGVPTVVLCWWAVAGSSRAERAGVLTKAAATSVGFSLAAAVVAVALALPIAVLGARHRSRFTNAVESLTTAGYALPGLVVALALVFFSARYVPFVYQTSTLVVAAYVIRFLPEALGPVRTALATVDPALEEASRSLGRGRLATIRTVTVPLVRGGLGAGGALVFLTSMKELPATLLLRPPGVDTLAVRVWTGAAEGFYAQAAPAALLLLVASAFALAPLGGEARR